MIEIKDYCFAFVGMPVTKRRTVNDTLDEFEKTQDALRESIAESTRLAKKSQALLNRHRRETEKQSRENERREDA